MQEAAPVLSAVGLYKTYRKYAVQTEVLRGLDLEVHPGEFLSVVGASGSGKSTLLHLLGVLDRPDKGEILLDGQRIDHLPSRSRDQLRNQTFGFIFRDRLSEFASNRQSKLFAAQSNLRMDAPGRNLNAFGGERFLPGEDVGINTIDESAIQVEN